MPNFSRFCNDEDLSKLASVIAFDPGETTGWCVMGVQPVILTEKISSVDVGGKGRLYLDCVEYGEIDCAVGDGSGFTNAMRRHAGLNFGAEAQGVKRMLDLCFERFPGAAIVLEDFIPDTRMGFDKKRHTLSPIRIISAFSYGLQGEVDRIFVQDRANPKTTCSDDRLKKWGLYDPHSGRHSRDATRHAYYFLRRCRGSSIPAAELRWLAWPHIFSDPMNGNGADKIRVEKKQGTRIERLK